MRDTKGRFIKGHTLLGGVQFKKGDQPWSKGIKLGEDPRMDKFIKAGHMSEHKKDDEHYLWKGDLVGKPALHEWVKRKLGRPSRCSECGTNKSKRFDWHNLSGEYHRDLDDWIRLCTICHAHRHKNWRKRWAVQ